MKKIISISFVFILSIILSSCNKNIENTDELYEKSQTRGEIIKRSGTTFLGGGKKADEVQWKDAQNRLQSGGGLFGKKSNKLNDFLNNDKENNTASIGFAINPYLWKASLETIDFLPLSSADPFGGIIITDWYKEIDSKERCKLNIFIKGVDLKTENLKVNIFCQQLNNCGAWVNQTTNINDNVKIENAILNKAKKIRIEIL